VESQFDTAVVAAFEAILASADEPYRMGISDLFTLGWTGPEEALVAQPIVAMA
jgi:hypothetical protein